jgi:hypothetical protein
MTGHPEDPFAVIIKRVVQDHDDLLEFLPDDFIRLPG